MVNFCLGIKDIQYIQRIYDNLCSKNENNLKLVANNINSTKYNQGQYYESEVGGSSDGREFFSQ